MLRKLKCIILLTAVLFFSSQIQSKADLIFLKNGRSLEGIVEEKSGGYITLNIGIGKISLRKDEVEKIVKYNPAQSHNLKSRWEYKYFGLPQFTPKTLKTLSKDFEALQDLRNRAVASKQEKKSITGRISNIEASLQNSNKTLVLLSEKLTWMKPNKDNIEEYNSLIEKFNSLQAEIEIMKHRKDGLLKRSLILDKAISGYITELEQFKKQFFGDWMKREFEKGEERFIKIVKQKLQNMESDFTRHMVDCFWHGESILVKADINDTVKADFVVDTGATLMVISRKIADELALDLHREKSVHLTLADGKKVKARTVRLKKVKVGDLEAKEVLAAILDTNPGVFADGLLGMSFLKNFMLKINPKDKKLLLEEFTPN